MASRFPDWQDIKRVVEFKTFYLALLLAVVGIALILGESYILSKYPPFAMKGALQGLGLTLVTSSAVSVLTESALRLDLVDLVVGRVKDVNSELLSSSTRNIHPEVERFLSSRHDFDFGRLIREASGEIEICGVTANDILAVQQLHVLARRFAEVPTLRVRVVILNPRSHGAECRAKHRAYPTPSVFFEKSAAAINALMDYQDRLVQEGIAADRFQVRVTDMLPSTSFVITSKEAIFTPLLSARTGGSGPTLVFRRDGGTGGTIRLLVDEFESYWSNASALNRSAILETLSQGAITATALAALPGSSSLNIRDGRLVT